MATPELSFVERVETVESSGTSGNDRFLSEPARLTTFFEFDASQRDQAVDEVLELARQSGFDLVNQLPDDVLPLAKYTATGSAGTMLSVTVSETNMGVEVR